MVIIAGQIGQRRYATSEMEEGRGQEEATIFSREEISGGRGGQEISVANCDLKLSANTTFPSPRSSDSRDRYLGSLDHLGLISISSESGLPPI